MRVIYDKSTGRVAAFGDALEPGEGQAMADLTPDEAARQAEAAATVEDLGARLRSAMAEYEAAKVDYGAAADGVRERFGAAEAAASKAGGAVGYDPKRGFVTIAVVPQAEPTPDEDEALVASDPRLAALLRVLQRQGVTKAATAASRG